MAAAATSVLWCPRCGTMLDLDVSKQAAVCALCGASRGFAELSGRAVTYASAPEAFLQRFGIEPTLPNGQRVSTLPAESARERATVEEKCVACGETGLDFHTAQLRSADEGQTVFYECRACHHKWSVNT